MSQEKVAVVVVAVVAATAGITVAEATEEEPTRLEPFPCSELPNDPNEPGTCYRVVGEDPSQEELNELVCDLPLPPEAPPDARKPPFCDEATP